MHLYMQPVQDITVDDRVSRTQYQYTLEDPDTDELNQWTNKFVGATEEAARTGRRGHGPADRRPRGAAGDRPRDRIAAGHCADHDRQHALRRLWAAPDQHALHAAQPVPRGAGDRARVAAESRQAGRPLHSVERLFGRHRGRRGHVVLFFGLGVGRLERSDHVGALHAVFTGSQRPQHRAGRRHDSGNHAQLNQFLSGRQCHSAQRIHPDVRYHRGSFDQPSGTVPVGDGVVQPCAQRLSGHGDQRHRKGGQEPSLPCQPAIRLSGHRGVLPQFALQRSVADSCRAGHGLHRSRRSCTRASFIPSPFFPRCLRPAWARCWRSCSAARI